MALYDPLVGEWVVAGPFTATVVVASNLSVGWGVIVIFSCWAHLTASARFHGRAHRPGIRPVIPRRQLENWSSAHGFPLPFGHRHSLLGHPLPAGGWALLTVGLPNPRVRTPTGFPRSARTSSDRVGCPPDPGDNGAHPDRGDYRPGACRFATAIPAPRPTLHHAGLRITRHQRGFKQFARPVFPWPVAARMERAALGLYPWASHPASQELDDARQGGDRPSSTDLELPLNSLLSISNRVVHSLCATSGRTSPTQ